MVVKVFSGIIVRRGLYQICLLEAFKNKTVFRGATIEPRLRIHKTTVGERELKIQNGMGKTFLLYLDAGYKLRIIENYGCECDRAREQGPPGLSMAADHLGAALALNRQMKRFV